jgi:hypothetical protein
MAMDRAVKLLLLLSKHKDIDRAEKVLNCFLNFSKPATARKATEWAKLVILYSHGPTLDAGRRARAIENLRRTVLKIGKMDENHIFRVS